MLETLRSVLSLLSSYGLLLFANGLFGTLIGLRTKMEDFPTEVVGVIAASYFLGLLSGALLGVRVVSRVGHIRAFAAFASIMSVSALLHVLWIQPWAWALFRMAGGFCMAGMVMVTESWLNARSTNATRGRVMSLYMITNYLSAGLGQLVLPLGDPGNFKLFSVASIIFSVALVPVLLTRASAPPISNPRRMSPSELWSISPLGLTGALCAGSVNAAFFGLGPVFAHDHGLDLSATSRFMASVVFGGLLLQWPAGRLSDRTDRRWVIIGMALAAAAAGAALIATAGRVWIGLYVAAVVYGGVSFTVYSLCAAHTNDFADPEARVQTASGLLVAYGIGAFFGPLAAGVLMGWVGPNGLFQFAITVFALLGSLALYRMHRRRARAAGRAPAIALPGGQFTAGVLQSKLRDEMDRHLAQLSGGYRKR